MRLTLIILILTLFSNTSSGQVFDRYGINFGATISTQEWWYKIVDYTPDNQYAVGFQSFLQAEKDLSSHIALRAELGYVQKRIKNNLGLSLPTGIVVLSNNKTVILHNQAVNLGFKLTPFKTENSPYVFLGVRTDYLTSYKDIVLEELPSRIRINYYESTIRDFNEFNYGGLIAVGIKLQDLVYGEIEYNPNFSKNLDNMFLAVRSTCWGVKMGFNINQVINRNK